MKKIISLLLISLLLLSSCVINNDILSNIWDKNKNIDLHIVSWSENQELEYIINRFAKEKWYNIKMSYKWSLDIFQSLNENSSDIDAIWPASSVWENLLTNQTVKIKYSESIFKTPIVFAIKKQKAIQLWLVWKELSIFELLELIKSWKLSFAMTNATQSNSWFSWYLSFLVWFLAKENQTINLSDLDDEELLIKTKNLLKWINRSSWSSSWLKDLFINKYDTLDAMVNYESLIIDTNKELQKNWKDPLYSFYLKEWVVFSNSPLSYIDKTDSNKEKIFLELQSYLLSSEIQNEIQKLWRRTWLWLNQSIDTSIYNEDLWIKKDISKLKQIVFPSKETFNKMLDIYINSLKKPSYTVYVIDTSWSMQWKWIDSLKEWLKTIFTQDIAKNYFLQAGPKDKTTIITFNSNVDKVFTFNWNSQEESIKALNFVNDLEAGWWTNMYLWLEKAIELIKSETDINWYFPSIILMSDWESEWESLLNNLVNKDIPVFPISFWDSNDTQLKNILNNMVWEFFDWKKDLIKAFKKAKWFN